jgi:hypothetical protein
MRGWTGTNNIQFQSEMLAIMGFDEALRTNTETAGHCRIAEDRVPEHLSPGKYRCGSEGQALSLELISNQRD